MPVGLGHNGHTIALCLQHTSDDCRSERRVVYISVSGKEDDIQFVPSAQFTFLAGGGKEVGQLIVLHLVCNLLCVFFFRNCTLALPVDIQKHQLMQSESLHVAIVDDVEAQVQQVFVFAGLRLEHGADVELELVENIFIDDAIAVDKISEQCVSIYGL